MKLVVVCITEFIVQVYECDFLNCITQKELIESFWINKALSKI